MFAWLKRHPFPVCAHFSDSVVLTYAVEPDSVQHLVPPGLRLDTYRGRAFVAIAMVQTEALRPAVFPCSLGQAFFLAGYRVFVTYRTAGGRTLRGLRILGSYTDRRLMVAAGNLLTHYNYHRADVCCVRDGETLHIATTTPDHAADLDADFDLAAGWDALPPGSPFETMTEARRFAGPLPFTFDYDAVSHAMVIIEGRRQHWRPRPVRAEVRRNTFVDQLSAQGAYPVLANCFHVSDVDYQWLRGRRERLRGRCDD